MRPGYAATLNFTSLQAEGRRIIVQLAIFRSLRRATQLCGTILKTELHRQIV
jgi:hypothetical protein